MTYPQASTDDDAPDGVPANPRFPQIEERVLAYWREDDTFRASVEQRDAGEDGANEFVFYDGPPFANGLPHYGHLLTGYVKDLIPRYQTMRGRRVERRFGWDTHGLPAELEAMRQLGIKTTDEIVELGVEAFNDACRASVMEYTGEWVEYVTRQARWVDFEHDYRTMNADYMESVMWAFKQLHEKGWIYEGFRVLPYCWNDETPLSNHELRMDEDVYQMVKDPAVTVGYPLDDAGTDPVLDGALVLIWTTTPWTLPSNLAVMVGSDIDYVVVEAPVPGTERTERYLLAEARLPAYTSELAPEGDPVVLGRYRGADLVGRTYRPPFSYYDGHPNAFRIVAADDAVTTTDGTGVVHTAGAFGEVDKEVTDREGIEAVMPVGKDGRFTSPVDEYAGMLVFDANLHVIDHLRAMTRGEGETGAVTPGTVLLRRESYEHSYPHCWRCREPLIYKGVSSWFVEVTAFKQRMVELNQQIRWVPQHIKDGQFGKWLENARDWSITRNRFWGSPVPVWVSDDPAYPRVDVYGSFAELEADFGAPPRDRDGATNLHRPWVDLLTRPNPDDPTGRSTMRRVPDVLDVWFDSGSMSFAQVHYPFENADWFEHHFPGDFIVEYIGQTRGWFYTMHVLASGIFDKPAFETCLSHGIVLGSDGQKMSKSLRNYPDVREVFDRDGADAMRWFLMSSPILRGGNLIVTEQAIREGVRQVLIPLWNCWSFFALYANAAGYDARRSTASEHPMDRYLLAKTRQYVETATRQMDDYEVANACDTTRGFLEVLSNWYIRRSRERFWAAEPPRVEPPRVEPVETDASRVEPVEADASRVEPVEADASRVEPVEADASRVEPVEADASRVEPVEADASRVEPVEADASRVEPVEADASRVEPVEADASRVEPVETDAPSVEPVETDAPRVEPVETDAPRVEPVETAAAFDTLFTVLETVCRVAAPLLPLTAEEVWRGLTGERSVHLTDWPSADDLPADDELVEAMDQVRDVCSAGSALRKSAALRNRLPLSTLTVVVEAAERLAGFEEIVADELNVKTVRLLGADQPEASSYGVSQRLTVNARVAGPRLGKDVQTAIKGSKSGDWSVSDTGEVTSGGLLLQDGEFTLETVAAGGEGSATGMLPGGGFVVLDTAVTPELEAEGVARDLVRTVQQARRGAGLDVSDRIVLTVVAAAAVADAARTHADLIARETLATSFDVREDDVETPVIELARA